MARGKHAAAAAHRRSADEANRAADLAEHALREAEGRALAAEEARRSERDRHLVEVAALRRQIEDATSEEVARMSHEVDAAVSAVEKWRLHFTTLHAVWAEAAAAMVLHFVEDHGLDDGVAVDRVRESMKSDTLSRLFAESGADDWARLYSPDVQEVQYPGLANIRGWNRLSEDAKRVLYQTHASDSRLESVASSKPSLIAAMFDGVPKGGW